MREWGPKGYEDSDDPPVIGLLVFFGALVVGAALLFLLL